MRVVFWGTYDLGKPRNRILLRGMREAGIEVVEIRRAVWTGVADKGHVAGAGRKLRLLVTWLFAYPRLVWRYLRAPRHDAVLIGYMGHLDAIVLWPFAKLRGVPVIWDVFLSLYDTVVEDRQMISRYNPLAWLLFAMEWLACRAATQLLMDTRTHADHLAWRYALDPDRIGAIFVGVETEAFPPCAARPPSDRIDEISVLFYGQFIPLHGIETIVDAAQAASDEQIRWVLIGRGQEDGRIRRRLAKAPAKVDWIDWVDYRDLGVRIAQADVCLGIFGDTDKAARVIPNKVFQILSSGAPLITRDSPAIRELLSPEMEGVWLIPPADPEALLAAVRDAGAKRRIQRRPLHQEIVSRFTPGTIGSKFIQTIAADTIPGDRP